VRDPGHAAGPRLIDYARFVDPAGDATAILAECGQHGSPAAAALAVEVALRFLVTCGTIAAETAAAIAPLPPCPKPREIEVTTVVTAETDDFVFLDTFIGMEVIAARDTPIGRDGPRDILTPHDDCIMIMPVRRPRRGQTAVRLGRVAT
jgi:hypothetical protein